MLPTRAQLEREDLDTILARMSDDEVYLVFREMLRQAVEEARQDR